MSNLTSRAGAFIITRESVGITNCPAAKNSFHSRIREVEVLRITSCLILWLRRRADHGMSSSHRLVLKPRNLNTLLLRSILLKSIRVILGDTLINAWGIDGMATSLVDDGKWLAPC